MPEPRANQNRILVIASDQPDVQDLVSLLSGAGYKVGSAAGAQAALEAARAVPPDLILLDTSLPGLDAGDLCRRLKSACSPDSAPILLIAAQGRPAPVALLVACEAADHLSAPLQPVEVLARVATHLELRAVYRQLAEHEARLRHEIARHGEDEARLRQSEERYRQLVENVSEVIFSADERGVLTYVSPAVEALLGYRPSEVIGRHVGQFIHPDDTPRQPENLGRVLAGQTVSGEYRLLTRLGAIRWVRTSSRPTLEGDRVTGVYGVIMDVTERRLVEQASLEARAAAEKARNEESERRREAERRREIAEGLQGVMAALNSDQHLDQVLALIADQASRLLAAQTVAIYRLRPTDGSFVLQVARGLPLDDAGDEASRIHQALGQSVATRRPAQLFSAAPASQAPPAATKEQDLRLDASPGSDGSWTGLAVPVLVKDQAYGGMLFCSPAERTLSCDEIELAQAFCDQVALAVESSRLREQVEQAAVSAERSRLARDLHDSVTQSLFSASLVTDVLAQVWERDPAEAIRSLEQLRRLTRGALAEMRAMLLELLPTALLNSKLDDLVRQLAEALAGRIEGAVTVDVHPVPALPPEVHVTFYRIAQEALQNAAKHAEADHITVRLGTSPALAPDQTSGDWRGQVRLQVSDDGKGFDPASVGANQLGLRIMRERAEGIGARLTVGARRGQGTQITLAWRSG